MRKPWDVAVLIPARDEELLLGRCLESVLRAIDSLSGELDPRVVVVSDSSTDRTANIAADVLGSRGTVLKTDAGAVGRARALGATHLIATARVPLERMWIANTDADCVIPARWLDQQIELADRGIEAIAGIVGVDSFEEHGPGVPARFEGSYLVHTDGWHPHIHGANLGVRADCYLRAGGWAGLKTGEDHDLWRRLRSTGVRTYSTGRIRVVTSGRRTGRAPNGFAAALEAHNSEPAAA